MLLVDVLQQAVVALERRHQERAVGPREPVDGLQPVPRPRLYALRERVVGGDCAVDMLGLVALHVLLELFLRVGDDREVLRGDSIPLRAVAVPADRDAPPARLARRQHDAARDTRGEVLLVDAAIDDFTDQGCHSLLLKLARCVGRSSWSAGLTRDYGPVWVLSRRGFSNPRVRRKSWPD